jgi:guanylate kinase
VVAERMANAAEETSHWREYDYILVNDDVEQALEGVRAVLQAERLRRDRQTGLVNFVRALQQGQ